MSLQSAARSDSPEDVEKNETEVVEAESAAKPQTQSQPGAADGTVAMQSQQGNIDEGYGQEALGSP